MSKIRHSIATAAAVAIAVSGNMVATAPQASAMTTSEAKECARGTIYCSMYYARGTDYTVAKYGTSNRKVYNLQKSLIKLGFGISKPTSYYGSETKKAVLGYQISRKLRQTGVFDYSTQHALRVGAGGSVPTGYGRTTAPVQNNTTTNSTAATKAVKFAYAQIGKPYGYGATGPYAYDCSGLTQSAYKNAGVSIPRTSYSQLGMRSVSKSNLRPGDIVGYYSGGHVGIYVGNGYIIHSSRPGKPVAKVPLGYMPYYKAVRPVA